MACTLFFVVANRVVEQGKFQLADSNLVAERHYGLKPSHVPDGPTTLEDKNVPKISDRRREEEKHVSKPRKHMQIHTSSESDFSEDSASSEESDLESCTIKVSGVSDDTLPETVKMFFESRRTSGGGKIDGDIRFDKKNGNCIITFTDRECKYPLKK